MQDSSLAPTNSASLLLSGAAREDAIALAIDLMGPSHKIEKGSHPDLHILEPEGKSLLHPMANIQKLIREAALPPFEAPAKVFILFDAEKMLPPSSNALLKTLEEPPVNTYFLLTTDRPTQLLPTIISRLHSVHYNKKPTNLPDIKPYLALAYAGVWDKLLEALSALEEQPLEPLLHALTHAAAKTLTHSRLIEEAQTALARNVKPRAILLHLMISLAE